MLKARMRIDPAAAFQLLSSASANDLSAGRFESTATREARGMRLLQDLQLACRRSPDRA
jgi:hypothetical protein